VRVVAPLVLILLVLGLLVLASSVPAEDDPNHRYTIQGRVTDAAGVPACGLQVEAEDVTNANVNPASSRPVDVTDAGGRYLVRLHLHDPNLGDEIRVRVVGTDVEETIRANFDPTDPVTERVHPLDLVVPGELAQACPNPVVEFFAANGIWLGATVLVLGGGYVGLRWLSGHRPAPAPTLRDIPGIGGSRMETLRGAGIRTVRDLAEADPKAIARETSISLKEAKRLVRKARERLGDG
jgi:hypothetical protein